MRGTQGERSEDVCERNIKKLKEVEEMSAKTEGSSLSQDIRRRQSPNKPSPEQTRGNRTRYEKRYIPCPRIPYTRVGGQLIGYEKWARRPTRQAQRRGTPSETPKPLVPAQNESPVRSPQRPVMDNLEGPHPVNKSKSRQ